MSRSFFMMALIALIAVTASTAAAQEPVRLMGAACTATATGLITEAKTGRTYMLDYPCDLKAGERVTFILSLHGGGSSHTWQRQYFPAYDYKDQYRLVVATPFSPTRSWSAVDDAYLQNIVTSIVENLGRNNVQAFWLAGHSQGGMTSRRLVCTDFFKGKVDGFLSLSGGRLGGAPERAPGAGRPAPAGPPTAAQTRAPAAPAAQPPEPTCDFSHIFEIGQHEIVALPPMSAVAQKYQCGARVKREDVVDTKPGYVYASGSQNPGTKQWGLLPRPGKAEVFQYPNCSAGHVVADVVRMDKGHTEGLEPRVTEELVKMLLSARGGKIQREQNPFRLVENWAQVPPGFAWGELADADLDAQGNLWVLHRPPTPGGTAAAAGKTRGGEVPVLMFDGSRKLVKSFGQGMFLQPHGLHVDPEGNIWVTDSGPFYAAGKTEGKGFQVFKFNRDGKLLMTLGKAGVGVAGPDTFVGPTDVVVNARGEIFVADGHTPRPGSADGDRIVKLSKDGRFIKAWGSQRGSGPGEVIGPHRLALDSQGRLFVADRGNRRIQIFDQDGRFLDQWTQFGSPSGIWIDKHDTLYVAVPGQDGGIKIGSAKAGSLTAVISGTSPEVAIADSQGNVYSGLVGGQKLQQFVKQ